MKSIKYLFLVYIILLIATISGGISYEARTFANEQQIPESTQADSVTIPSASLPQFTASSKSVEVTEGIIPNEIEIPSLNLKAPVQNVGKTKNGQMGVPDKIEETGWYKHGFKPGEAGNAVIAGHVDGRNEPGAFFRLKKLKKNEKIIVRNETDKKLVFTIKSLKAYDPEKAPVEKIFGYSEKPGLNLITCTGDFNHKTGNYEQRLVVYAQLDE